MMSKMKASDDEDEPMVWERVQIMESVCRLWIAILLRTSGIKLDTWPETRTPLTGFCWRESESEIMKADVGSPHFQPLCFDEADESQRTVHASEAHQFLTSASKGN